MAIKFGHLLGSTAISRSAARAEEDDERKRRDGESDEDYKARLEKLDKEEGDGDDDKDGKKGKKAKGKKAEGDDGDEGDDDSDEEETAKASAVRSVRLRERARCAAIFSTKEAAINPAMAAQLAFGSGNLTRSAAIDLLKSAVQTAPAPAASSRQTLDQRMQAVSTPNVGPSPAQATSVDPSAAMAQAIIAAGKKRRGEI